MDLTKLLVQVVIALVCAGAATFLIPRKIPGKLVGLVLIGFAGVWLGEWAVNFLSQTYELPIPAFLLWNVQEVLIIPAIIGSAVILYIVTALLSWGRYQR